MRAFTHALCIVQIRTSSGRYKFLGRIDHTVARQLLEAFLLRKNVTSASATQYSAACQWVWFFACFTLIVPCYRCFLFLLLRMLPVIYRYLSETKTNKTICEWPPVPSSFLSFRCVSRDLGLSQSRTNLPNNVSLKCKSSIVGYRPVRLPEYLISGAKWEDMLNCIGWAVPLGWKLHSTNFVNVIMVHDAACNLRKIYHNSGCFGQLIWHRGCAKCELLTGTSETTKTTTTQDLVSSCVFVFSLVPVHTSRFT